MTYRFLWIEDALESDLQEVLNHLYVDGIYHPVHTTTATDGYNKLIADRFDAVIVDIRIPPGSDKRWRDLYMKFGERKDEARLGMHLLDGLFRPASVEIRNLVCPDWLLPQRVGIISVESSLELGIPSKRWGIDQYLRKGSQLDPEQVISMLTVLVSRS